MPVRPPRSEHLPLVRRRPPPSIANVKPTRSILNIAATIAATTFVAPAAQAASTETSGAELKMFSLRFGSLSVYSENDKFFAGTDQNYTNGFKISALSTNLRSFKDRDVPRLLRNIADQADNLIEPDREPKIGLSLGQNIYTPTDIQATAYQANDRPYAAWLYLGAAFHNYRPAGSLHTARVDVLELNLGMVGPGALGRQVQNAVHNLIGVDTAKGWANQIHNEPGLNLIYESKWRWSSVGARTQWGLDFIPHGGVCLGNVFTYLNAGAEVRFGYRLPDDFGASLIRPTGDSNSQHRERFNVFVFAGAEGRAIARDITLDGNSWRDSPSINKRALVYDLCGGIGFGTAHWQCTYTQARRSREFEAQIKSHDFGSLSFSHFF